MILPIIKILCVKIYETVTYWMFFQVRRFPYSVQMQENAEHKSLKFGHFENIV